MNYYAKAIEICADQTTDWKSIVVSIAKHHPKVVVDNSRRLNEPDSLQESRDTSPIRTNAPDWLQECRDIAPFDRIKAVRIWRNNTGDDFKRSLEMVKKLAAGQAPE